MNDAALLIRASLAGGDKHGYGIMLDIQKFAAAELGQGTLCGAITRLVAAGWIPPGPDGPYFSIDFGLGCAWPRIRWGR
jgi:DNA-binding PadR family transcriptional regulator